MVKKFQTPLIVAGAVVLGFFAPQLFKHFQQNRQDPNMERVETTDNGVASPSEVYPNSTNVETKPRVTDSEVPAGPTPEETGQESSPSPTPINTGEVSVTGDSPVIAEENDSEESGKVQATTRTKSELGDASTKQEQLEEPKDGADNELGGDKKGSVKKDAPKLDRYGFEVADGETQDLNEIENRLIALEQAFSVEGRRNKNRPRGDGWGNEDEIAGIKESLSNLYEIVEELPSIDTLQAKMQAVDVAIEEMNGTIEAINSVAKKIQNADIDVALKASGEAVQAANDALGEVKKIGDAVKGLEKGDDFKDSFSKFETKMGEATQKVEEVGRKVEEAEQNIATAKGDFAGLKSKQDGIVKNIALLDKNIQVLSSSYKMVYENALRVDERLGKLEEGYEKLEKKVLLLESNLLPPE